MRRISAQYAEPGMVLAADVFDYHGNLMLSQGTRLTLDNISAIGGGELHIEDRRVDDIPSAPLMPARLEWDASRKLTAFLTDAGRVVMGGSMQKINADALSKAVYGMVGQLFPIVIGEANAAGCFSLKDYNFFHPVQAASLSLLMGRKLGCKETELCELGLAALLQNIGYLALEPGMMDEPGTLSEIEKHEVHQHPNYAYEIIHDYMDLPPAVVKTVLEHHERWNGSGYPKGMAGGDISLFARIIGIADTYYALVSRRPHRQKYLPHEAVEFIMAYSGELFDPELVLLFTKLIPLYPTGMMVNINTGEKGIIINSRLGYIGRPVVRICYDKERKEIKKLYDIDLAESQHQHRLVAEVSEY